MPPEAEAISIDGSDPTAVVDSSIPNDGEERDALIAAVQAAETEGVTDEPGAESAPKPEKKPKAATPPEEVVVAKPKPSTLGERLRSREEQQLIRDEASRLAKEKTTEVDLQSQKVAEMMAKMEAKQVELEQRETRLREAAGDPVAMAEYSNMTQEQLAQRMAISGSPEDKLMRELRTQNAKLEEKLRSVDSFIEEQKQAAQRTAAQQQQAVREHEERLFLSEFSQVEKYPALAALYGDDDADLVQKGYKVQALYHKKTGSIASHSEILEYLEESAKARIEDKVQTYLTGIRQQAAGSGVTTKKTVNGPRTLSASSASERRASPRRVEELSDEDERKLLEQVASEAIRTAS